MSYLYLAILAFYPGAAILYCFSILLKGDITYIFNDKHKTNKAEFSYFDYKLRA